MAMLIRSIKIFLVFISLFYFTFYVPFVLVTYNPYWYKYNCDLHKRCKLMKTDQADKAIDNLVAFMMHREELKKGWRKNEKIHLSEVRTMFDIMLLAGAVSAFILIIFRKSRPKLYKFAILNLLIALCLFIVIPNFKTFWRDIFHPLLFDNEYWRVTRRDISYYITPRSFFRLTTICLLSAWALINVVIIALSALYRDKKDKYLF